MIDEEFWDDVAVALQGPAPLPDEDDLREIAQGYDQHAPCTECGSTTACGWDAEGRPLFHQQKDDDEG